MKSERPYGGLPGARKWRSPAASRWLGWESWRRLEPITYRWVRSRTPPRRPTSASSSSPMPEALPPDFATALRVSAGRRGSIGEPAWYFVETASTNDEAGKLAERGAPQGTTVIASAQTAGRGRL